jgi:hypothetical protein
MITFCGYFAFGAQTNSLLNEQILYVCVCVCVCVCGMLCSLEHDFTVMLLGFPIKKCNISSIACSHFVVIMHPVYKQRDLDTYTYIYAVC